MRARIDDYISIASDCAYVMIAYVLKTASFKKQFPYFGIILNGHLEAVKTISESCTEGECSNP